MKDYLNENISGGNIYLSHYFLIRTLANYRVFLVKEEAAPPEYDSGFLDALIKYITENDSEFSEVPLIMLHVNEILLLKTKSDKYYFRLKEMLASGKGITRDHRYSLLNILQTYCVHKEFRGDKNITKERFELYKLALENKFHRGTQDIYFDALLFPSIARIAINAGEFDWAEQFMMKYEKELQRV